MFWVRGRIKIGIGPTLFFCLKAPLLLLVKGGKKESVLIGGPGSLMPQIWSQSRPLQAQVTLAVAAWPPELVSRASAIGALRSPFLGGGLPYQHRRQRKKNKKHLVPTYSNLFPGGPSLLGGLPFVRFQSFLSCVSCLVGFVVGCPLVWEQFLETCFFRGKHPLFCEGWHDSLFQKSQQFQVPWGTVRDPIDWFSGFCEHRTRQRSQSVRGPILAHRP